MLAAILLNPATETTKSGVHRLRQNRRDQDLTRLPDPVKMRDFREQDPDFKPKPRKLRDLEIIRGRSASTLEGDKADAGSTPAVSTTDVIKTPDGETVQVDRLESEVDLTEGPTTRDLQAMMAKAREVGLAAEMARAILEDDEDAILVIMMAL